MIVGMHFINDDDLAGQGEQAQRGMFRADASHERLIDGAGAKGREQWLPAGGKPAAGLRGISLSGGRVSR